MDAPTDRDRLARELFARLFDYERALGAAGRADTEVHAEYVEAMRQARALYRQREDLTEGFGAYRPSLPLWTVRARACAALKSFLQHLLTGVGFERSIDGCGPRITFPEPGRALLEGAPNWFVERGHACGPLRVEVRVGEAAVASYEILFGDRSRPDGVPDVSAVTGFGSLERVDEALLRFEGTVPLSGAP